MKSVPAFLFALFGLSISALAQTPNPPLTNVFPGTEWTRTTPTAAGWDPAPTKRATDYVSDIGATSVLFIQHGVIVAQGGDTAARTEIHSCRKSFLSALIGIAVQRGQMHLDDTLSSLNIDDNKPSLSPEEKQATVRMLLEARSGVYHEAEYETAGMADKRPERGSHPPGTFWYYNNWDFNTLGAIYEKSTGHSIYESLATEIGAPIGMQDFRAKDGHYVRGPRVPLPRLSHAHVRPRHGPLRSSLSPPR